MYRTHQTRLSYAELRGATRSYLHAAYCMRRADRACDLCSQLTTRLSYVQGELERLAGEEGAGGAGGASRLCSLKAEFTSLLHEVRKRQARQRRTQDKQSQRRSRMRPLCHSPEVSSVRRVLLQTI